MSIGRSIRRRRCATCFKLLSSVTLLSACSTAELKHAGNLSSYEALTRSDGMTTKSEVFVDTAKTSSARTVRIVPTAYAQATADDELDASQRGILTNMIDRSLCQGLSSRLRIVQPHEQADLVVRAVVTDVRPTDVVVSGVSKVVSVVPALLSSGIPVPVPRIPVGLGSLSVEAEAADGNRAQAAAMVWARQADVVSGRARLSKVGDAYDLAGSFGDDFSRLIVNGSDPMKGISIPSMTDLLTKVGINTKDDQCNRFGDNPGIKGLIGGIVGLPPEWIDNGK